MSEVHFHFSNTETSFDKPIAPLVLSDEERLQIDRHWERVNTDGRFFNGKILAATQLTLNDVPEIQVCSTDYAHYLYSKSHPETMSCRIVYCGAVVVTTDNHMLVGEMAASTSSPGQLQFAGGNIEVAPDGSIHADECCRREIEEELGAAFLDAIERFEPLCIKTGGKGDHVGIYYLVPLKMTAEEAKAAFEQFLGSLRLRGERPELPAIHFVELTRMTATQFCEDNSGRLVDYLAPLLTQHLPRIVRTQSA